MMSGFGFGRVGTCWVGMGYGHNVLGLLMWLRCVCVLVD